MAKWRLNYGLVNILAPSTGDSVAFPFPFLSRRGCSTHVFEGESVCPSRFFRASLRSGSAAKRWVVKAQRGGLTVRKMFRSWKDSTKPPWSTQLYINVPQKDSSLFQRTLQVLSRLFASSKSYKSSCFRICGRRHRLLSIGAATLARLQSSAIFLYGFFTNRGTIIPAIRSRLYVTSFFYPPSLSSLSLQFLFSFLRKCVRGFCPSFSRDDGISKRLTPVSVRKGSGREEESVEYSLDGKKGGWEVTVGSGVFVASGGPQESTRGMRYMVRHTGHGGVSTFLLWAPEAEGSQWESEVRAASLLLAAWSLDCSWYIRYIRYIRLGGESSLC